ncbi:MAG: hypothetical protein ACRBBP_02605 [Bdellovibrionales bacterium]
MNANALLPYKYNWTKIKSEHFTVVVDKDHSDYGKLVAQKAELAFKALQKFSKKHPKNTFIIVDHTKGFSNGSATFFPYPIITLQPVSPPPSSSVGQYKDWLYELLVHEYTHILTFHNTRGLFRPLRWVLGSAMSPGYFMPTWYQEGIAVFTETHLSNGGRLRSSSYQGLQKELKRSSISIANEDSSGLYPYGSGPYIYGAWLNQKSFSSSGIKGLAKAHKVFSGRIPYFINGGYKRSGADSLYSSWRELFGDSKEITSKPASSFPGRLPKWMPSKESLYFIRKTPYLSDQIIVQKNNRETVLLNTRNILDFKVLNDTIFYLSLSLKNQDHQVYSLFSFDLKTKKTTKLSKSQNIQSFDLLPNGDLAFVDAQISKQVLYLGKLNSLNDSKELFITPPEGRISFITFKNKKSLLFSLKSPNSNESIISINFSTKKLTHIFSADHIVGLEKSGNKFHVLHESKGVKHLQELNKNSLLKIHPAIESLSFKDTDQVFSARILSDRPHIFIENLESLKSTYEPVEIQNQSEVSQIQNLTLKESSYSSFSKLQPHYIVPNTVVSPYGFSGELLYGLSIGSQDPLGLNSYSLSASTDTLTKKISASANYTSRHFKLPISFSVGTFNEPLSLTFFRESTFASLGSTYTFRKGFGKDLNLSIHSLWNATDLGSNQDVKRVGLASNLSYNSSELRSRELSPRKGYRFNLGLRHYIPVSDYYDYTQANIGLRFFAKSPLVSTHRLILGIDAEINDDTLPTIFSSNSLNQPYRTASAGSFALRGLPTGALFATDSFAVAHLEYRFPVININWGPGLLPGFFKRVTAALTADYGSMKGADFINNKLINHSTPLYSAGGELVFEGKLFYHLPASLQIGLYKFLNSDIYSGSPEVFVGFGLSGLPY